jgi:multidrug transporter EmrE-like cation transporter
MNEFFFAVISVLGNVGAQVMIKMAGRHGAGSEGLASWFSPWLLLACALYGSSFLLSVKVFAVNSLSTAAPIMAGATMMLVAVAGAVVFGESISPARAFGICLIAGGIFVFARRI